MSNLDQYVSYFNTTDLGGSELMEAVNLANSQEDAVLAMFDKWVFMSPSHAWEIGHELGRDWLLTSVRRAISVLTTRGLLVKLPTHVPGNHGRPEFVWVRANHPQGDLWGAK